MSLYIISWILLILLAASKGGGFDYPSEMAEPKDAHLAILFAITEPIGGFETPMAIRYTSIIDAISWNCVAVYHSTAFDAITKQRPIVVASEDIINSYGNSNTRVSCLAYAITMVSIHFFNSITGYNDQAKSVLSMNGLDDSIISNNIVHSDVANCDASITQMNCLQNVAAQYNFVPEIMGSIVAYQAINYLKNDGWNEDGSIGKKGKPCTANCRPYSDTTNYKPNYKKKNRWVPLLEDNGKGFFYHYGHVTPHIGEKAVTKTISRKELERHYAPKPHYDYKYEKQLVIDRLADLAMNDTQKMLVEFFDNKVVVAVTVLLALDEKLQWSLEERIHWMAAYTATEYDAVIQSWRAKVSYDLIRPTSLIKRDGKKKIITYGGPYAGLQEIQSQHFESYHRVMPHSEYPSGSGCLCLAGTEFTDILLRNKYGVTDSLSVTLPIAAGSSIIEPGVTPDQDLLITFKDLTQYSDICGESRLWGGMHFTASISGAYELCAGLGQKGYEYAHYLLNGQPI